MFLDRATVQEDGEYDCDISAGTKDSVELNELLLCEPESVARCQYEMGLNGSMPYVRRL